VRPLLALLLGASLAVGVGVALVALAGPASAQSAAPGVRLSFDIGAFDAARHDFLIEAVVVSDGLREGEDFTVALRGAGDRVLWSATRTYSAPSVRIALDVPVGVAAVTSTDVAQAVPPLEIEAVPPQAPSAMEGTGGSGQLTLSMVVTLIVVIVVFRSPLPSVQTSRWTK
jgi:hypothetical protein